MQEERDEALEKVLELEARLKELEQPGAGEGPTQDELLAVTQERDQLKQ